MGLKETIDEIFDDELELDLSLASDELDFSTPIEPGTYRCVVDEAIKTEVKSGAQKGKTAFRLRFKILPDQPFSGRTLFKHCQLAGKGAGITRDVVKALGGNPERIKLSEYVGALADCVVTPQPDGPYAGQAQIKTVRPASSEKGHHKRLS